MVKKDIVMLRGGKSFRDMEQATQYFSKINIDEYWDTRSWKDWLEWTLSPEYNFIKFNAPMKDCANYTIWKIVFEKYLKKIKDDPIVIANSLGTIFICKYIVENGFPFKIKQLHLVATYISNDFQPDDDEEDTASFTFDINKISKLNDFCDKIHLWHSRDDYMCAYKNAEFVKEKIPSSILHEFKNRGHFLQSTFLELLDTIRKDSEYEIKN